MARYKTALNNFSSWTDPYGDATFVQFGDGDGSKYMAGGGSDLQTPWSSSTADIHTQTLPDIANGAKGSTFGYCLNYQSDWSLGGDTYTAAAYSLIANGGITYTSYYKKNQGYDGADFSQSDLHGALFQPGDSSITFSKTSYDAANTALANILAQIDTANYASGLQQRILDSGRGGACGANRNRILQTLWVDETLTYLVWDENPSWLTGFTTQIVSGELHISFTCTAVDTSAYEAFLHYQNGASTWTYNYAHGPYTLVASTGDLNTTLTDAYDTGYAFFAIRRKADNKFIMRLTSQINIA